MAVTINSQPASIVTAFNEAYWVATSNQVAQPNFKYRVIITDLITSATITKDFDKRPVDNKLVLDSNFFAEAYVKHFIPNNQYGFLTCTDGYREIRVNIGEYYGTTPTYHAGSNVDYKVWNGSLNYLEFPNFQINNYLYNEASPANHVELTNITSEVTFPGKSSFLYFLSNNPIITLRIETYNAAGTFIATSTIVNPNSSTTDYKEKYFCIDVGHKGLSSISSGLVTGTYPIITSSVASYTVRNDAILAPTIFKNFTIGCEPKTDVYVVHYLARSGAFRTMNFSKASSTNVQATKYDYKQNQFDLVGNNMVYTNFIGQDKIYNSSSVTRLTLHTDWMSYSDIEKHSEIIDSPLIYLDTTNGLIPVILENTDYKIIKKWNTENPYVQLTFRYAHTNRRQRG